MSPHFPTTARLGFGGLALLLVLAGSALPATAAAADPADGPGAATVEEQRLDRA
ncbi:pyroglutamyl peptidase, partial [Streptomyces sp. SID10692]|nr:pyroglutamyl peptidase [Streptomyces sp. SID10692]